MDYAKQYPREKLPSIWFIDKTIRQAGLQTKKPKNTRTEDQSIYCIRFSQSEI